MKLRIADCGLRTLFAVVLCISLAVLYRAEAGDQKPSPSHPRNREAAATVVIYNEADVVSLDLAGYYAQQRNIPFDHLIGLTCSPNEEISREEYDRTIAEPLRKIFTDRGWWKAPAEPNQPVTENRIRFVVLMRGMPLKIAGTSNYPGDHFEGRGEFNRNEAA